MILTVTLHPLLERISRFSKIEIGNINRARSNSFSVGGKGINVSRQLNKFGIENLALTFFGGSNSKLMKNLLEREDINFSFVQTKESCREAYLAFDENDNILTTFFNENYLISDEESGNFREKLNKTINASEMIVFSGSSPSQNCDTIFPAGLKSSFEQDKITFLDTYGPHLSGCFDSFPRIAHNNVEEVENSLKISLQSEENKIVFINSLFEKGVAQYFLTDGGNPIYAGNCGYIYRMELPSIKVINPIGSGDAFMAGLVYAHKNYFNFEDTLKFAAAAGIANANILQVCESSLTEVEQIAESLTPQPIGKKMIVKND